MTQWQQVFLPVGDPKFTSWYHGDEIHSKLQAEELWLTDFALLVKILVVNTYGFYSQDKW